MDFSNRILLDLGFDVPVYSPARAAEVLTTLNQDYDLCLYEFFLTDLVGHRGTLEEAVTLLQELDQFLSCVVANLNSSSLIISSDHGNIEDMSHGLHTTNPVPTLLWGEIQEAFPLSDETIRLDDITPRIKKYLDGDRSGKP